MLVKLKKLFLDIKNRSCKKTIQVLILSVTSTNNNKFFEILTYITKVIDTRIICQQEIIIERIKVYLIGQ